MEEVPQRESLKDRCNPTRLAQPSCTNISATNGVSYELKASYISTLPKFTGLEDLYVFIREFEEVCNLMKLQQLNDDVVRLRFITFALKYGAKRWLYSLSVNSISTWDEFVVAFLKKYYPNHKTARIRNEISLFK